MKLKSYNVWWNVGFESQLDGFVERLRDGIVDVESDHSRDSSGSVQSRLQIGIGNRFDSQIGLIGTR